MIDKSDKNFFKKNLIIGYIKSSYGIFGWIKLLSFTEKKLNIFKYQPWFIYHKKEKIKKLELEKWKIHSNSLICKIKQIDNRNDSEKIIKHNILIILNQLPKLNHGEFYWKDIIGCKVYNTKGFFFGKVKNLLETKSNDVLCVYKTYPMKQYLIPFIFNDVIKKVNVNYKTILVEWNF